jgi:quercetin dioxygenase-like cupin family protein
MPTPGGAQAPVHRTEKDSGRYRLLGGQGEVVLVLDKAVLGMDAFSQQRLTLQPGAAVPAHSHPGSAEILYVISGQSEVKVDGNARTLQRGEAIAIPAGAQHAAKAVGKEPFQAIQFYVPGGPEQRFRTPTPAGGSRGDGGVTSAATPR